MGRNFGAISGRMAISALFNSHGVCDFDVLLPIKKLLRGEYFHFFEGFKPFMQLTSEFTCLWRCFHCTININDSADPPYEYKSKCSYSSWASMSIKLCTKPPLRWPNTVFI
jgi:hypothetical protein